MVSDEFLLVISKYLSYLPECKDKICIPPQNHDDIALRDAAKVKDVGLVYVTMLTFYITIRWRISATVFARVVFIIARTGVSRR